MKACKIDKILHAETPSLGLGNGALSPPHLSKPIIDMTSEYFPATKKLKTCSPLLQTNMASDKFSIKIENKVFHCAFDLEKRGRFIKITELLKRVFSLSIEEIIAAWIIDPLEDLWLIPQTHKFFKKTDCCDGFIWIQKVVNKRGNFIEITKVLNAMGKRNLVIPIDKEYRGWKAFREMLIEFLNKGSKYHEEKKSMGKKDGTTCADIVKNKAVPPLPPQTHPPYLTPSKTWRSEALVGLTSSWSLEEIFMKTGEESLRL